MLAERFGWTPSQVDNEPAPLMDWMIAIADVAKEVEYEELNKR